MLGEVEDAIRSSLPSALLPAPEKLTKILGSGTRIWAQTTTRLPAIEVHRDCGINRAEVTRARRMVAFWGSRREPAKPKWPPPFCSGQGPHLPKQMKPYRPLVGGGATPRLRDRAPPAHELAGQWSWQACTARYARLIRSLA